MVYYKYLNKQFLKRSIFNSVTTLTTLNILSTRYHNDASCEAIPTPTLTPIGSSPLPLPSFRLSKDLSTCSYTYPANHPIEDRFVTTTYDINTKPAYTNSSSSADIQTATTWEIGAVFDGHGGWQVADLASKQLIPYIMISCT